jgi:UDP-N-acetylmuramate--alanine ligase
MVQLIPGQHVHIVGISGFGMSAIARVLLENGYVVSGSDRQMNDLSQALMNDGASVFLGHQAEHIAGAELVLVSSAVAEDNPEVIAAYAQGIPVSDRRDFIATLTEGHQTIAVAGTHGKTTTTAMLVHVLSEGGLDPSFIVGGVMKDRGTNAGAGSGEQFVIEADEYGYMFLGLEPQVAVITNVEWDHPDFFHTPEDMLLAFRLFLERLPPAGLLVACADDDVVRTLADERRAGLAPVQTYGVNNPHADWWAIDLKPTPLGGMEFVVCHGSAGEGVIGSARISVPGQHNVQNAMGVIAVARHLGIPFDVIVGALESYAGTGRRSELMGEAGGVRVVSDYAHHPTAIRVTLRAWREQLQNRGKLWAVWQPHTYSRTRALADSFKSAFSTADHVLVTDIYAAREEATPGLFAKDLAQLIREDGHPDARYSGDLDLTAQILANEVRAGDVVLLMTAGDAPQIGLALLDVLYRRG